MLQKRVDGWWLKGFGGAIDLLEEMQKDKPKIDLAFLHEHATIDRLEKLIANGNKVNDSHPEITPMLVFDAILEALEARVYMSVTQGFTQHDRAQLTVILNRLKVLLKDY